MRAQVGDELIVETAVPVPSRRVGVIVGLKNADGSPPYLVHWVVGDVLVLPKLRIDVVVPDEIAESVVSAIAKSVNTGTIGGGKIWVSTADSVLRARTGERGRDAV